MEIKSLVRDKRVLVVGAGGIGCELLKNLALTGFKHIEVVDLDTIDLSNLNRQFLFRRQHINQSKSKVAADAVKKMNHELEIVAHHANIITDQRFDIDYFSKFDIVLNALDNLEARRHVNLMCQASQIPLVESGTAGLLGQAQPHLPNGKSECFDCVPHETPKKFAVCTIRSTPSKPIHCIVWAKSFLFPQLFGEFDEIKQEENTKKDEEEMQELTRLREEALELKRLRESVEELDYVENIFNKVFCKDIERIAANKETWKDRQAPKPIRFKEVQVLGDDCDKGLARDHEKWSIDMNIKVFIESCRKLGQRAKKDGFVLEFDKDDEDAMDFCTAASNLRSMQFGIEEKTRFEVKQMAGNIIPAIATTNAIIAGLVVLMAIKVLQGGGNDELKSVYLSYSNPRRLLCGESLQPPNDDCHVCTKSDYRVLVGDLTVCTLGQLVDLLVSKLDMDSEALSIMKDKSSMIYDADFNDNVDETLSKLGVKQGSVIIATNEDDDSMATLHLFVKHSNKSKLQLNSTASVKQIYNGSKKRKLSIDTNDLNRDKKLKQVVEIDDDLEIVVGE